MKIATGSLATALKNISFLTVIGLGLALSAHPARAGELMDWLAGDGDEDTTIAYPERPPLVVPPALKLPEPKSLSSASTNPAWPKDPDIERKRKAKEAAMAPAHNSSKNRDPGRPLTVDEIRAGRIAGANLPTEEDLHPRDSSKPLTPQEMQALNEDMARFQAETSKAVSTTERVFLTDPPSVYRKKAALTPEMEAQAAAAGQPVKSDKPWYQFW